MVSDALSVFGIPDSPPALQAYSQWQDATTGENAPTPEQMAGAYEGAMRAVVGDRPHYGAPPKAVVDLMRSLGVPGFNTGGTVVGMPGIDQIPALLTNREFVVNASAADRARPLLEHINAGGDVAVGGGRETHYHIHGGDTGDLMRQLEARELLATMQHLGG